MDKTILFKFFSHKTTREEEEKILEWLDEDPDNLDSFLYERSIFDSILLIDETNLGGVKKPLKRNTGRWKNELAKIAAVIAVVVTGTYFVVSARIKDMSLLSTTFTMPTGQRGQIILPDGTTVWLNSLSTLEYPIIFTGKERKVRLHGEAFFDVKPSKNRFIVETPLYNVEVLGTRFDVIATGDPATFTTSVLEGRVRVTDRNDPSNNIFLHGLQEASLNGGTLVSQEVTDMDIFRWKEGLICFRNARFTDLLSRLEKSFDVKMQYDENDLPDNILTGKFRISDGLFHTLRVLQSDVDFTYEWNENEDVLKIRKR